MGDVIVGFFKNIVDIIKNNKNTTDDTIMEIYENSETKTSELEDAVMELYELMTESEDR